MSKPMDDKTPSLVATAAAAFSAETSQMTPVNESRPISSVRLAVFASGRGTNFRRIYELWQAGAMPEIELSLLVCDKACGAADFAAEKHFPLLLARPHDFPDKAACETLILSKLREKGIELIALAGYLRLVGEVLLSAYPSRILNLHPSLLPAYPGKDAIARIYAAAENCGGVSVHLVDAGLDSGPLLAQEAVLLTPGMSLEDFEAAVHRKEHELYPQVIRQVAAEMAAEKGRKSASQETASQTCRNPVQDTCDPHRIQRDATKQGREENC